MRTTDTIAMHRPDDWWEDAGTADLPEDDERPLTKKERKRRKKLRKLEEQWAEWEQINDAHIAGNTPGPPYPATIQPTIRQRLGNGFLNGIAWIIVVGGLVILIAYWIGLGSLITTKEERQIPWDSTIDGYSESCQSWDEC